MTNVMKKVSITIMVAVFVATMCLSMAVSPLKAYADKSYAIGDIGPAGGIIFWDQGNNDDGWRYLEAAPSDQSTEIVWITGGNTQTTLNGNTSNAFDTGQENTNAMMAQSGYTGGAAQACDDYTIIVDGVTYDDWFLPSKDALDLMYWNLKDEGLGGFDQSIYWSSSEEDAFGAYYQDFTNGAQGNFDKSNGERVRAIRAFSGMEKSESAAENAAEKPWVRSGPMVCYQVWINEDNQFQFVFWYPYKDNNWVKIYDMSGKMVYEIDMPYDNPNIIVDLPNGTYTVKTFTVGSTEPIQTFVIGK